LLKAVAQVDQTMDHRRRGLVQMVVQAAVVMVAMPLAVQQHQVKVQAAALVAQTLAIIQVLAAVENPQSVAMEIPVEMLALAVQEQHQQSRVAQQQESVKM
jgi:predicted ABC-type exoprotein transport system permease subunit